MIDAHVGVRVLVAVHVVDDLEQDDDVLQKIGARLCNGDVAKEREPGVLSVDLAGVNTSLHEHDGLALFPRQLRRKSPV